MLRSNMLPLNVVVPCRAPMQCSYIELQCSTIMLSFSIVSSSALSNNIAPFMVAVFLVAPVLRAVVVLP